MESTTTIKLLFFSICFSSNSRFRCQFTPLTSPVCVRIKLLFSSLRPKKYCSKCFYPFQIIASFFLPFLVSQKNLKKEPVLFWDYRFCCMYMETSERPSQPNGKKSIPNILRYFTCLSFSLLYIYFSFLC